MQGTTERGRARNVPAPLATLHTAGLLLRRLRVERGLVLLLFLVVAATSFLFTAAPRLFNQAADDALVSLVASATPVQRNVFLAEVLSSSTPIAPSVQAVRAAGDKLAAKFPPALATVVGDRSLRITSVRFVMTHPPSYDTAVSLRYEDGLAEASRLVAGRWPVSTGAVLPPAHFIGAGAPAVAPSSSPPVTFEVALSASAAADTGITLGDRLAVTVDESDPMLSRAGLQVAATEILVVGLFEPIDPAAPFWSGNDLAKAVQVGDFFGTHPSAQITAAIAADAFPGLAAARLPFRAEWQFATVPQRLDAGGLDGLRTTLKRLDFGTGSELSEFDIPVLHTGLPPLLDAFAAQLPRTASLLSLAAIGPLALAGAVLAMLAVVAGRRRRTAQALARGRGASGGQLLATELVEGALLAGLAAALGLALATAAVPARASLLSPLLAAAIALGAVALLAATSWAALWRPLGRLESALPEARRDTIRRLVIELTVVAIAAAGALLIRERGLAVPATGDDAAPAVNPLLSAVPVLCGLAAAILAVRLYPLPVRLLGWLAARRRDLVPVLGMRSIRRHGAAASLSLLVLLLTAAFGSFASVVAASIDRGQVAASYADVGADYRIERTSVGGLDPSLTASRPPGVMAVAQAVEQPSTPFRNTPGQVASVTVVAVQPVAYTRVVAGLADSPPWPLDFLAAPPTGEGAAIGTQASPIPAILSARLPGNTAPLAPGATFHMTMLGHDLVFRLLEQRAGFGGLSARPFALVPLDWVRAATGVASLPPNVLWLRAGPASAAPLGAAVTAAGATRLISRYETLERLRDAPFATATVTGFGLALVVAVAYMALAVAGVVILSAARRNQDLAYLRTLGVTVRQSLGLTLIEQAPPALLAVVPGMVLGVGVAVLLEPGLGLAALEGIDGQPLAVDWGALLLQGAALLVVVAASVVAGTRLSLRVRSTDALRIGEH